MTNVALQTVNKEQTLSLSEQAYKIIKRNILDLTYEPGSDLTEARLAEELEMSRMPIRSALHRLELEDWLIADFRKKTKVKPILKQDVLDIYQMRSLLEIPAMEKIFAEEKTWEFSFVIEEGLLRIKANVKDLYERELAETDLHMAIVNLLGNKRIDRIYRNAQDELIRIGLSFVRSEERDNQYVAHIIQGWEDIILAIRERRKEDALRIFDRDHLSGALELALKQF
ncbi:MAG TPA: GntR family transcriptional regulator [Clostridiaceae bacterium]|nr:GntR family transcriptional regulator [Clostridiaceae bacterium]